MGESERTLQVGWAETEITPEGRVLIAGLFHARLSEGVLDPLTATALALESGGDHIVLVSCDTVTIPDELRDAVRERLYGEAAGPDPMKVVLHATHTHTGPEIRVPSDTAGHTSVGGTGVELEETPVVEVIAFVAGQIADAVVRAWNSRAPGGFAFGLGYAVIGRNRRWIDVEGNAIKYDLNRAVCDRFRHIEGYEDHSVNIIATYDEQSRLTGLVVNVPCPPQLSESEFKLSADWWHEARQELRRRFGEELHVLPQCSAAGDLCPFPLYEQEAHARMQQLMGRSARQEVADRLASAVEEILPHLAQAIDTAPVLRHVVQTVELTASRLSAEDAEHAKREAARWREVYERGAGELGSGFARRAALVCGGNRCLSPPALESERGSSVRASADEADLVRRASCRAARRHRVCQQSVRVLPRFRHSDQSAQSGYPDVSDPARRRRNLCAESAFDPRRRLRVHSGQQSRRAGGRPAAGG